MPSAKVDTTVAMLAEKLVCRNPISDDAVPALCGNGVIAPPTGPGTSDGEEPSAETDTPVTDAIGQQCDATMRRGRLRLYLAQDRTVLSGAVSDGVDPNSVPVMIAESGSCQLLGPRNLFCDGCANGETCDEDGQCLAKPQKISAGTVSVTGLAEPLEVMPNGITGDYSKTILEPFPAFQAGDVLSFSAAGDETSAFQASVWGVSELNSPDAAVAVQSEQPVELSWEPPEQDADHSAIFVSFTVNAHGAVTGWIECIAPDSGSFTIPADLVTQLMDLGLSGFPRVELERRSSALVEVDGGCIDIIAGSSITLDLEVDGLVSCSSDAECPDSQVCSSELVCE